MEDLMVTRHRHGVLLMGVLLLTAATANAGFQAADLIYINPVANIAGSEGSIWNTDVYVYNADTVDIDVMMVFLATGLSGNPGAFIDRTQWLGGREDEGFGYINEELADIPPGGTVTLVDILGEYWQEILPIEGTGAIVVFAYEAGTLEPDGSRVFRNAIVNSRIYNTGTIVIPDPENEEGEEGTIETDATFGQISPGVPWYDLEDPGLITETGNWSFHLLVGGVENDIYRYNVGVLNASDPQTVLTIGIQPLQPNGEPYLDLEGNQIVSIIQLAPLAHLQFNRYLAGLGIEEEANSTIKVSHISWSSGGADPKPALTSYGSFIDNRSNDPTSVLPSFSYPFDVDCIFLGPDDESKRQDPGVDRSRIGRVSRRPLSAPPIGRQGN
jgi:hypothetical protein